MKGSWSHILIFGLIVVVSLSAFSIIWQTTFNSNKILDREILFQVSAFNTFSSGNYDGYMTYGELAEHGDFGIGTFDSLDGEMIALDGIFYQIPVDGMPKVTSSNLTTPYATVTFFEADRTFNVAGALNYSELTSYISSVLSTQDAIYAIKVTGLYSYVKTRSVPMQSKPYPTLTEVVKNQSIFTFNDVSATSVGFWFPESMDGVDYTGYHLHLITSDYMGGGHLLDCIIINATIQIDQTNKFDLILS